MHTVVRVATTTRKLYRREVINDQPGVMGTRSLPDGQEEIRYEASLNLAALDEMARKAAGNRRQRSIDGPLTVKVVSRKKL